MNNEIVCEKAGDVSIIRFCFNEINLDQREMIKEKLEECLVAGDKKFIIDLSKVGFLSSLVIALIVFFAKEVKASGGEIKLSGMSGEAAGVFKITQLDKVFEVYDTKEDALESFKE